MQYGQLQKDRGAIALINLEIKQQIMELISVLNAAWC